MPSVDLHTVSDVIAADDGDWRPGDRWLAGGSYLYSQPQPDVRRLRDLTLLGWPSLRVDDDGVEIAATCTIAELARFTPPAGWTGVGELIRRCCDALLASHKVWNVATVGGNICAALPAGPMTSLAVATGAWCVVDDLAGGRRSVPAVGFVRDVESTVLSDGEYLRSVRLPASAGRARYAMRRASLFTHGRSAALVVGRADPDADRWSLSVTAATRRPVVLRLTARLTEEQLREQVDDACAAAGWVDDVHGLPAWRRHRTLRLASEVRAELTAAGPTGGRR
ncbi:FAD binding domain-containing protein [Solwaraspora sp. WMMD791]|uniref:FAD binding domain-containing protein n=1 Tax=Solwaraspora sp. WMMD791 TaxID=3016086 RepID=UPI002499AF41|nr:FAD binding domain-containing protein [Solwaraspora sp. WMMD791]WFE28299.1 FAD binding domain-containing protein [Solwaraspora sp. WMMD791]